MKYEATINEMFSIYHESWMNAQDKVDLNREILRLTGKTMEQLDEDIEIGVRNGYPPETQILMARTAIALMRSKSTLGDAIKEAL